MPKVNIYLPDDLAAAVRARSVPVSEVCQRALRREVERMTALENATTDAERVAERLRATRDEGTDQERREGFEDGTGWARDYASWSELVGVAELSREHWTSLAVHDSMEDILAEHYGRGGGRYLDRDAYAEGFVDGAVVVHDAMEPLV